MAKRKICVVGPMVGENPGMLPTQGEFLARQLSQNGYPVKSVSRHPNRYFRLLDIISVLWRERKEIDIQLLQVFGGRSFVIEDIASMIGKRTGQKIVMVLRGGDLPVFAKRFPDWTRRLFRRADIIVAPSKYLAREMDWLGLPILVIPNIINLSFYPYHHRTLLRPKLLWMRAFYDYYNPGMALQVLGRILQNFPQATLTLAGPDMGLQEQIRAQAKRMGLTHRVVFPGFLDTAGKLRAGSEHDIYLNTNRIDNMPVSVLEMAAMGVPVVATTVGGIPDLLVNNETGLLVPSDDWESMAKAVQRLLQEPELAGRLSENGRKLAESCAWENIAPQWENVFETVLS